MEIDGMYSQYLPTIYIVSSALSHKTITATYSNLFNFQDLDDFWKFSLNPTNANKF